MFHSQAWTISVWGDLPSTETELRTQHCRETEEDSRRAERPFQKDGAVTGSNLSQCQLLYGCSEKTLVTSEYKFSLIDIHLKSWKDFG